MSYTSQMQAITGTNYTATIPANFNTLAAGLDALVAMLSGSQASAVTLSNTLLAIFGSSPLLIGSGSYASQIIGTSVQVSPGAAWLPNTVGGVVKTAALTTLSFSGQAAGTYYISTDVSGVPKYSASSTDALFSVAWSGAALSALTQIAQLNGLKTIKTITAAYQMLLSDNGSVIVVNAAAAINITAPANAPAGFEVTLINIGAGVPTILAGVGNTMTDENNAVAITVKYARVRLLAIAASTLNLEDATAYLALKGGTLSGPVIHTGFTVALLPATVAAGMVEGAQTYATNGRKTGEGAGAGTGVPVYFSSGSWRVFSTDAAVAA